MLDLSEAIEGLKALILAGGYATRLRPLSYTLPKQLFPILDKPIIEWTLEHLSRAGVGEAILLVNYLSDMIRGRIGSRFKGLRIRYCVEPVALGTGGPIRLAAKYLRNVDSFLAMNGDVLAKFQFREMLKFHAAKGAIGTIALHRVKDPSRFGLVDLGEDLRIKEFVEKPRGRVKEEGLINAGAYAMSPEIIRYIPGGRRVAIEREVFPKLASKGALFGFLHRGSWFDIGSIPDYVGANFKLLEEESPRKPIVSEGSRISRSATLIPPAFIGRHVIVRSGARVGPYAVIGHGGIVSSRARVRNSILMDNVHVGRDSCIDGAVIGSSVGIGDKVSIGPGGIIASYAMLHDNVKLAGGVVIHPHKEIEKSIRRPGQVL